LQSEVDSEYVTVTLVFVFGKSRESEDNNVFVTEVLKAIDQKRRKAGG